MKDDGNMTQGIWDDGLLTHWMCDGGNLTWGIQDDGDLTVGMHDDGYLEQRMWDDDNDTGYAPGGLQDDVLHTFCLLSVLLYRCI